MCLGIQFDQIGTLPPYNTSAQDSNQKGYCKFPDGTLICWGKATIANNSDRTDWFYFPQTFVANPIVTAMYNYSDSTSLPPLRGFSIATNGMYLLIAPKNTTGATLNVFWQAIGRWKA
jgi:hypothetical protein